MPNPAMQDFFQRLAQLRPTPLPHSPGPRPSNTHIHLPPNFSAFDTVEQAVRSARSEGVRVLGVSNYYDYTVYGEFVGLARDHGLFPLFGTEILCMNQDLQAAGIRINDPANPGRMYLCGKAINAFDPLSGEALGLLDVIRRNDARRMAAMVERMDEIFREAGLPGRITEVDVRLMVMRRHDCPLETVYLQERHVAQAFQEALARAGSPAVQSAILERAYGGPPSAPPDNAVATQNEIRARLMKAGKPAYVEESFVDFDHAVRLIRELGGIPCYPVLADGASPVCEFETDPDDLIARLRERDIFCAEFIPNRNAPETLSGYASALRRAGIVITAGTEHNTRDMLPMAPRCLKGAPIPPDVEELFWEGTCVLAAHLYRRAVGERGLVDGIGSPEEMDYRICEFRKLGEALLEQYLALADSTQAVV